MLRRGFYWPNKLVNSKPQINIQLSTLLLPKPAVFQSNQKYHPNLPNQVIPVCKKKFLCIQKDGKKNQGLVYSGLKNGWCTLKWFGAGLCSVSRIWRVRKMATESIILFFWIFLTRSYILLKMQWITGQLFLLRNELFQGWNLGADMRLDPYPRPLDRLRFRHGLTTHVCEKRSKVPPTGYPLFFRCRFRPEWKWEGSPPFKDVGLYSARTWE